MADAGQCGAAEGGGVVIELTVTRTRSMQERVFQRYLDTIWCIASSRYVRGFVIGYTSMSSRERFVGYQAKKFGYIVVIADHLSLKQALSLEEALQIECKTGAARGAPYKRKYCPNYRDISYRASTGQGSRNATGNDHSVYMAWYE